MMIRRETIEHMLAHAEQEAPIEACGYLMGLDGRIIRHHPMTNTDKREDHFTFEPNEQFAAYKTARQEGLRIVGAYHSHPVSPARPSVEDIRLAYDPALLYVIVSLMDGQKTVKGFYIRDEVVEEEPLIVEENNPG